MKVTFWVGDWSKDGHNQSDTFVVDVHKLGQWTEPTKAELDQAFHDGCIKMGLDEQQCKSLSFLFCAEYEDNKVPTDFVEKMKQAGLDPDNYFDEYNYSKGAVASACPDTFHLLWLDIAKLGNSNLYYEECKGEATYHIGGYGLYY